MVHTWKVSYIKRFLQISDGIIVVFFFICCYCWLLLLMLVPGLGSRCTVQIVGR